MKTPWHALHRAGERIGDATPSPSFASMKLVSLFYFVVIASAVFLAKFVVHLIAPQTIVDLFFQTNLDAILLISIGSFAVYAFARTFWDSFWDSGVKNSEEADRG